MKISKAIRFLACSIFLLGLVVHVCAQYSPEMRSPAALENFKLGVTAYQAGRYSNSIVLFEKALAYESTNSLIRFWLGRSYLKIGQNDIASRIWQPLLQEKAAPPFLTAKSNMLESRWVSTVNVKSSRYIEVQRFDGNSGRLFLTPTMVDEGPNGTLLAVSHGSGSIIYLNKLGTLVDRLLPPLGGFDKPYGLVALPDGAMLISEFNKNRIIKMSGSAIVQVVGKSGRKEGEFIGPGPLAYDGKGYVYAIDFGNLRAWKIDSEGAFILSLDGRDFSGFASPSGIAVEDGFVYVSDAEKKAIYIFDESGNFIKSIGEGYLHGPEGLRAWQDHKKLLIADTDRIVSYSVIDSSFGEVWVDPDRNSRLVDVFADQNGNIIACDSLENSIVVLSDMATLAAGLDVEIAQIDSSAFPKITTDVIVRDASGRPIVGLDQRQFIFTETSRSGKNIVQNNIKVVQTSDTIQAAKDVVFEGAGDRSTGDGRVVIILDAAHSTKASQDALRSSLELLYASLNRQRIKVISAITPGQNPARQSTGEIETSLRLLRTNEPAAVDIAPAIKLAINSFLPSGNHDSIIYLGAENAVHIGCSNAQSIVSFLEANGIGLHLILGANPSSSLQELVDRMGGQKLSTQFAGGFDGLAQTIAAAPNGRYRFSYTSRANKDINSTYISFAVEAYSWKASGKDELGFYIPSK